MRVEIVGKHYSVSNKLEDIIYKKVEKQLARYFKDSDTARIVCKEDHGMFIMELTIALGDSIIRAEVASDNMYGNIDLVVPKVERQMRKYRTKWDRKLREGAFDFSVAESEEQAEPDKIPELVRTKKFILQRMSVEDAIFQLDMVDNNFYIFLNDKSGNVNVIYKRRDKDVGLIEAEY
jgi:putative sigma-54 modulation protein